MEILGIPAPLFLCLIALIVVGIGGMLLYGLSPKFRQDIDDFNEALEIEQIIQEAEGNE